MARGRPKVFDESTLTYIRDNPDQLTQSELAMRFSVSIQTIKRAILRKGAYKEQSATTV